MKLSQLQPFIFILMTLSMINCDRSRLEFSPTQNKDNERVALQNCTLENLKEDDDFLAIITCPDGNSLHIPKPKDGVSGDNGQSCTVETTSSGALISCEDGSQAFVNHGSDGHSCSVSSVDSYSSLIQCTDGTQSMIDLNSLTQFALEELIDPCGDDPGHFDEVIMRFKNGDLLAYFENGGQKFLTKLSPGNYQTTDHQKCKFNVNSDGVVTET